ncbi:DUF4365 domain-containing protein [Alcaligenes sp. RM2]
MDFDDLPQYCDYLGDKGVRMVDRIVSDELKWIFRDLRKADLGIDAQIELVSSDQRGTGRLIAAQIKCGSSYFSELTATGIVFRGQTRHLKYWIEHSLPVLIILCSPDSGECYWQEVSSANTEVFSKGWKVIVPFKNLLGRDSEYELRSIAGRAQHSDIVEVLLYRFLHEKYTGEIYICTIMELPRDYHLYAYLAKIAGELVMIDLLHDHYGHISVEQLAEIIKYKSGNEMQCGATKLHIYVSSESSNALRFTPEVKQYIASQPGVTVFPVLYERSPFLWLSEFNPDSIYECWS